MDFKKMIKWGKTTKIVSIVAIALGGGLTIAGAAMLGVSGNKTISETQNGITQSMGVGFSNYATVDGTKVPLSGVSSYEDFVKLMKDTKKMYEMALKLATTQEEKDQITAALNNVNTIIQTYDIMVAGAVLLPIGALMAIIGTVFLVLNMKNLKSA